MQNEYMNYMGHHWILVEDNTVSVGMNEDALNEIDKISEVTLPSEGETVEQDDVIGELETSDGTYKIYAPVSGTVSEVNADVADEPSIIFDDPYESWLVKIEASDESELSALFNDDRDRDEESDDDDEEDEDSDEDGDEESEDDDDGKRH